MMKIEVLLSEENRPADFAETLRGFQCYMDSVQTDVRERARICIHEGGHAQQIRRYGGDVDYHGPYIGSDGRKALGAVSPKGSVKFGPFEDAAIFLAGSLVTRIITGTPDEPETVNHDLACLARKLNTTPECLEQAKTMGEFAVLVDMQQPDFLPRLEAEVRAYEREVYGTDEVRGFAVKDFCLHWFRERIPAGSNSLGYVMWLIPDGEKVRLFLHGQESQPGEKVHGCTLEVFPLNPGERAADVVRRWNALLPL
jgi:hypothetical protein